jgi:manganese transport protein
LLAALTPGVVPTRVLVVSQVGLSSGIPSALVPLVALTRRPGIMGGLVNRRRTILLAVLGTGMALTLDAVLLF